MDLFKIPFNDWSCLNIHPLLLGSGIPLFHGLSHQVDLELLECKPLQNGCVYLQYRVVG